MQNIAFSWADGSPGDVADLLRWAQTRLLLLVLGQLTLKQARQLSALTLQPRVVCVQVVEPGQQANATERVQDIKGHFAGCFAPAVWALLRGDGYVVATG